MSKNTESHKIGVVSKKGGVGKSTTTLYIAYVLLKAGKSVCVVDFDPDATIYKQSIKTDIGLDVFRGEPKQVAKQLQSLNYEYVVVDTPPQDENLITRVSLVADDIITPLAPTGYNADRLLDTISLVEEVETTRQKPLLSILITMNRPNVNSVKSILETLKEHEKDLPVLESKIRFLDRYGIYGNPEYLDEYTAVVKELGIL